MNEPPDRPVAPPIRRIDPLHGVTLEAILHHLVKVYGWDEMGYRVQIRCFNEDPSISSSLKFLRKTPWARKKVESLYVLSLEECEPEPDETALPFGTAQG
jgi:uncharacterized protein (DUF2132 family)